MCVLWTCFKILNNLIVQFNWPALLWNARCSHKQEDVLLFRKLTSKGCYKAGYVVKRCLVMKWNMLCTKQDILIFAIQYFWIPTFQSVQYIHNTYNTNIQPRSFFQIFFRNPVCRCNRNPALFGRNINEHKK